MPTVTVYIVYDGEGVGEGVGDGVGDGVGVVPVAPLMVIVPKADVICVGVVISEPIIPKPTFVLTIKSVGMTELSGLGSLTACGSMTLVLGSSCGCLGS